MSPGALFLKLRQKYGHGLRCAYYRDTVRPRILATAPVAETLDGTCEIHLLTCAGDWLNALWALKSFYWASNRAYALCIHDDGTLPEEARGVFRDHFPAARLISREEADQTAAERLAAYPLTRRFRETNHLAPKLVDFAAFLRAERMLVFDSDLLFFEAPQAMLERIGTPAYKKNIFNADVASAYTVDPEDVRSDFGFELVPRFNSGFGLAHKGSIRYDWIEAFLSLPGITEGHFWRIEQTLFALCSSRYGVELLPEDYALYLEKGVGDRPFRHYVGKIRHLMYTEGIARLAPVILKHEDPLRPRL